MIVLKNKTELEKMKKVGSIAAKALAAGGEAVKPGVTTAEINRIIHDCITKNGAKPSFLGYGGFPAAACISVNDEVIHGIPSKTKVLKEGDIVSIDVGAFYEGFHGDNAATFPCGKISEEAQKLLDVTKQSLEMAVAIIKPGVRLGDIGSIIQKHCEAHGFGVVRDFVGHGIGKKLHEAPEVPNFGAEGKGARLVAGMTIAIEPMINLEGAGVHVLDDDWTVKTNSGSLSAHFEYTVAVTDEGVVILTI